MLILVLAAFATTASAARTLDSQINPEPQFEPFQSPRSVAFDSGGNVWVTEFGQTSSIGRLGIFEFDPYPSQSLLFYTSLRGVINGVLSIQADIDRSTNYLYVALQGRRYLYVLEKSGGKLVTREEWASINGASNSNGFHVAVDNSGTVSEGRIYLSLTTPENAVDIVDPERRPVDFPATASYIDDNRLTGTPEGDFGKVGHIYVDHRGHLLVTDTTKHVVDEFSSTGEFVRAYPAPNASDATSGQPGVGGAAVDPTNGDVLIADGATVLEYDESGNPVGETATGGQGNPAVDEGGHLYVPRQATGTVDIFDSKPPVPAVTYSPVTGETTTEGTVHATVDPNGGGAVATCEVEYGTSTAYGLGSVPCGPDPEESPPGSNFSSPTEVSALLGGLTTGTPYHYRVVAANANGTRYGGDRIYVPQGVVGLRTDAAGEVTSGGAELRGSLVGDGTATSYLFEWGPTSTYGEASAAEPGEAIGSPSGPERTDLAFDVTGLEPYTTYHFRVVATGGSGTSYGEDRSFTTSPGVPVIDDETVSEVHSDRATFNADVNPSGARTGLHFEYVDDATFQEEGFSSPEEAPEPDVGVGMGTRIDHGSATIASLEPGTRYHYRAVATNVAGVTIGREEKTFRTYRAATDDPCPNAHARQQTGTSQLLDCRAYELASAVDSGGYDVESDLVPGQEPFGGYPSAIGPSRLLYGVHDGGIPGTGATTNHGVDPYVATRGPQGWETEYVGIPANNPFAAGPFASSLHEGNADLSTFAFGGPDVCSPCFADGTTGEPIRMSDGSLVQGMAGSLDPGPAAETSGHVAKPLSADGTHFVFGSTSQFEPDGNSGGDLTIYSRDLKAGVTTVVSKTPGGATMTGAGIAELDLSEDGSRVVIGRLASTDSAGNRYWHLYMIVRGSESSIDLMPGTTEGALYAGMTADGSMVYYSTPDTPVGVEGGDGDTSADLFRAVVSSSSAEVARVSTGEAGTGETDSCEPAANSRRKRWNSIDPAPTCDVLPVGGGGGVADDSGTVYFLSPEALDASDPENEPVPNAPNLYGAVPGLSPQFVATLESGANAPVPQAAHPLERQFGTFAKGVGAAIDRSTGDIYVLDITSAPAGPGIVYKYDANGNSDPSFGGTGKISSGGMFGQQNVPIGLAVDNDPGSVNYRKVFVPSLTENTVRIYTPLGENAGNISLPSNSSPTSVAVDPSNGNIHITKLFGGVLVFNPELELQTTLPSPSFPTGVAVDSSSNVFVANGGGFAGASGIVNVYDSTGTFLTQLNSGPAYGVAVDPADDHVFVDKGDEVVEYDAGWEPFGTPMGTGLLNGSVSLAAADGTVVITNGSKSNVASFGPPVTPIDPAVDNPVVVDSMSFAEKRVMGDFQVTPSGQHAVFTSTLPLSSYENRGHRQVFRYAAAGDEVACASCNPTNEPPTNDAELARKGLSISDNGRVFFNTEEGLVDRDLNERQDAYEWAGGAETELISTGTSSLDAGLLGVSGDATDAYFFVRDALAKGDANGSRVRVYDARSFGGYPYFPPEVPCKASDECHGASSQSARPPAIGSLAGTPIGNAARKDAGSKCKNLARRAKKNSNRAKSLRRKAGKAQGKQAKVLRRKAKRSAEKARRLSKKAKSCRRSSGGNG